MRGVIMMFRRMADARSWEFVGGPITYASPGSTFETVVARQHAPPIFGKRKDESSDTRADRDAPGARPFVCRYISSCRM